MIKDYHSHMTKKMHDQKEKMDNAISQYSKDAMQHFDVDYG